MAVKDVVLEWFAGGFGVPAEQFLQPGVHVVVDAPVLAGADLVYVQLFDDAVTISTPARLESLVRGAVEGRSAGEVFTAAFVEQLWEGDRIVRGPAWHGYADRSSFRPVDALGARRLGDGDAAAVERLRASMADEQWAEGGFDPLPGELWGIERDGALVAIGNLDDHSGYWADVGIAADPAHRGRGFATSVASFMTDEALGVGEVVRYRARFDNHASMAVAAKLGFEGFGANLAVRAPT